MRGQHSSAIRVTCPSCGFSVRVGPWVVHEDHLARRIHAHALYVGSTRFRCYGSGTFTTSGATP